MEEEIKEILEILKKCYDLKDENFDNYISLYQLGVLLDYIINLQEEIHKKEAMYDSLAVDYRLSQEENERLKNRNDFLEKVCVGFDDKYEYIKSINKKAIEYINQYKECEEYSELPCYETYYKDLDIILNGGENND